MKYYPLTIPSRFSYILVVSRSRSIADELMGHQLIGEGQKVIHSGCTTEIQGLNPADIFALFIEHHLDSIEFREMVGRDRILFGGHTIFKVGE